MGESDTAPCLDAGSLPAALPDICFQQVPGSVVMYISFSSSLHTLYTTILSTRASVLSDKSLAYVKPGSFM